MTSRDAAKSAKSEKTRVERRQESSGIKFMTHFREVNYKTSKNCNTTHQLYPSFRATLTNQSDVVRIVHACAVTSHPALQTAGACVVTAHLNFRLSSDACAVESFRSAVVCCVEARHCFRLLVLIQAPLKTLSAALTCVTARCVITSNDVTYLTFCSSIIARNFANEHRIGRRRECVVM